MSLSDLKEIFFGGTNKFVYIKNTGVRIIPISFKDEYLGNKLNKIDPILEVYVQLENMKLLDRLKNNFIELVVTQNNLVYGYETEIKGKIALSKLSLKPYDSEMGKILYEY